MNQKSLFVPLFSIIVLYCATATNASIVIQGDVKDGITSFSFPIHAFTSNYDGANAYIGANEAGHEEYALCKLAQNESYVLPVAPEKVRINNVIATNPIYNVGIRLLSFMNQEERIVVVTQALPESIFAIDNILTPENIIMFGIRYVFDASGTVPTHGIVALGSEPSALIFAAVTDNAGNPFGQTGSNSGIAVMVRINDVDKTQNPPVARGLFYQVDAQPGVPPVSNALRAALFDGTLDAVKIGSDATILNGTVNLIVNNILKTVYIGTQAQAGGNVSDGARSVIAANVVESKLIYKAIAPNTAFSAGVDNIIGTIGIGATVSCFKTRSMVASTDLTYLIVQGGVEGGTLSTSRTVYALPLVFLMGSDTNGTIAKKDSIPVTHFNEEEPYRVSWHAFEEQATQPADLYVAGDPAATVGNGAIEAGDITDIFVKNDAVFAVVSTPTTGYLSGLFYSRSLFDTYGRIKGWTTWQRVTGDVSDTIFDAFVSFDTAEFSLFTGSSSTTINTIKRTTWGSGNSNGMNPLALLVQKTFAITAGGLRSMENFAASTPTLDGISLVVGTGSRKVLIAQTAYTTGGILTPLAGATLAVDPIAFTGGTITTNFPSGSTNAITISGGALDALNPIVTAEIGQAGTNGWLFVGGIGGLAVLTDANGDGWTTLGNQFVGLSSGMAFKRIGNYSYIRKITYDDNFLYVLSDKTLDRIDLAATNFATDQLEVTTIATAENLQARSLLDLIVSDSFALLATSNGLFKLSSQDNIQTIADDVVWQAVTLPEGLCCVSQLYAIAQDNRPQDVAREQGGNIYVLDTDPGKNRAMVHRFTVTPSSEGVALTLLPDLFIEGYPSYFIEFDGMRNWIMADGDFLFNEQNRTLRSNPALYVASANLRSGVRLVGNKSSVIYTTPQGEFFALMARNSATGTLLLPTDQGLTLNE